MLRLEVAIISFTTQIQADLDPKHMKLKVEIEVVKTETKKTEKNEGDIPYEQLQMQLGLESCLYTG